MEGVVDARALIEEFGMEHIQCSDLAALAYARDERRLILSAGKDSPLLLDEHGRQYAPLWRWKGWARRR